MTVVFKRVSPKLAHQLLEFASQKNIGKQIHVDGEQYRLDYISRSSSQFHRSRGLSVYYRHHRSVIRISDHWSASSHFPRSRKLNCGFIDTHRWEIKNRLSDKVECHKFSAGKYPFVLLAGKAGLSTLNRSCEHWRS